MKFHQTASATIGGNLFKNGLKLSGGDKNNVNKVTNFLVDQIKRSRSLWRKEINHWQVARLQRYNVEMPRTYLLQEVFDDIMLDGHLTGITENRTLRTTNKEFIFVNKEGKKDDTCTEYIKDQPWFDKVLEETHRSTYRGYSLLWIKDYKKGIINEIELIDRRLVVPELGMLLSEFEMNKGLFYKDYFPDLIYCQMYDNVGLLEKAAPYTILKRHSWGSWDEFEELFGIPIRIAKVASQSETVKKEVAGWLEEMGSAPYGVFPIGTEIEIKENTKADAFNVFYQKIKALDAELSKLVLHQTMTTENGASKAQGNVHENTLGELIFGDEKKMLSILNHQVVPAMRSIGYIIPEGYKIAVSQTKDPKDQIKIDDTLMKNGIVLKKSYLEETYGSEIESMPESGKKIEETKGKL